MQFRQFGKTGLRVSAVGLGCANIGAVFQGSSRAETLDLLRAASDAGITLFDTADMYTQGESERLLGAAFRRDRDRVVIATKFGYVVPTRKHIVARVKPLVRPIVRRLRLKRERFHAALGGAVSAQDFSPTHIAQSIEGSLRRLNSDYIDIYQLHSPPQDVLRRGEFVEILEKMRGQGKIRLWGVACEQPQDALCCLGFSGIASIQMPLNVLDQEALDAAIPRAAQSGVGIIARQVFASGLLTRPLQAIHQEQLDADRLIAARKYRQLVEYATLVETSRRSKTELAIKFALASPEVAVALLGISSREQLDANLRALQATDLTATEMECLRRSVHTCG